MSTYDINKIQLPNGDTCNLKDSNAVHKTDYATSSNAGVVSVYSGDGISISNGAIYINRADNSQIKAGENRLRPIVPYNQHQAVFYGLTKVAGVDMASSDNAVGTYTDEAKGAIQNMLGINNMIAPIQTNTLAIQAYDINDLFWYNGKLYKATAAIAQNGNIVVGTNCTETKLTDNYISKSIGTAAGDMIYYSDNATPSRLEIGNQGQVLKVNSDGQPYWNNENVAEYKTLTNQEIATFDDGVQNSVLKSYSVKIEPKQNLHGYDKPWIGGAGKNLLPITVIGIKNANANRTWIDNTCTISGVSFTILTDDNENVIGINVNGTSTSNISLFLYKETSNSTHVLEVGTSYTITHGLETGVPGLRFDISDDVTYTVVANKTFTYSQSYNDNGCHAKIYITANSSINNIVVKPMIRLSTVADPTYEPYSNICPIEGWNEVEVTRTGKNLIDPSTLTTGKAIDASGQIVSSGGYLYSKLIPVNPNTGYTFSLRTTDTTASLWARRVHAYDFDGNWLSQLAVLPNMAQTGIRYSSSFVTSSTTRYLRVSYAGTYGVDVDAQIEVGSTATTYEPYIGQTTSINVKSINNNNTVYGGTLTINEDGGGELIVTKKILYVEDIPDASFTSATASNDLTCFWLYDSQSLTYNHEIKSDFLYHVSTVPEKGEVYAISTYPSSMQIGMPSALVGTTLESIRAYFKTNKNHTDNYFILDLKNPITYSLTASQIKVLLGTNTIWSDAGKMTITYPVNLKGYIDSINTNINNNLVKNTDTIPVNQGGTGATSFTENCVLVGNGTNTIQTRSLKVTESSTTVNIINDTGPLHVKSTSTLYFEAGTNSSHIFRKDATEYARFNSKGNLALGSGATDAQGTQNTHKLYVNGDSAFNGKISFGSQASNVITEKAYMQYNTTDNSIDFIFV